MLHDTYNTIILFPASYFHFESHMELLEPLLLMALIAFLSRLSIMIEMSYFQPKNKLIFQRHSNLQTYTHAMPPP